MSEITFEIIYVLIPVIAAVIFIYLSWQHVSVQCHTYLNSTSKVVLLNLKRCAENCWKKHDFGSDLENDDCYLINVLVQDVGLSKNDFSDHAYVKLYSDIQPSIEQKIKIRYNATGNEVSLVKIE